MARYDQQLIAAFADRPLTAMAIGEIVGSYGPDIVTRLRKRKDLRIMIVGKVEGNGTRGARAKNLYRIIKIQPASGPYCCGYCEQQRQIDLAATDR